MAEQKKFDKTSLIGMLLMGGILIWIMYFNKESEEEVKAKETQQEQVETAKVDTEIVSNEIVDNTPVTDSLANVQLQNKLELLHLQVQKRVLQLLQMMY